MTNVAVKMKMSPAKAGALYMKFCALEDENKKLVAENEKLRQRVPQTSTGSGFAYKCIGCGVEYNESAEGCEDCPACGCDGTLPVKV